MSEPLTPPDCDLTDFEFMPLDVSRLFGSAFHAVASDSEWRAGVTLWAKSWHQVPAASLPDDDVMLARLAEFGRDLKAWRKVRTGALRGWVKASDGRLYHPVVAEKALEAWLEKLGQRLSSGAGNAKRWKIDFDPAPIHAAIELAVGMLTALDPQSRALAKAARRQSHRHPDGTPDGTPETIPSGSQGTGTGTGTGTGIKEERECVVAAKPLPTPAPILKTKSGEAPPGFEAAWKAYPHHAGRSKRGVALVAFQDLPPDEQAGLPAACARFAAKVDEACGGKGAPDMAKWIADGRHHHWTTEATGATAPVALAPMSPELQARRRALLEESAHA